MERCAVVLTVVVFAQEHVTAVLTASPTDVLSHVAIRARSQQVCSTPSFDPRNPLKPFGAC
jgi:hypothetical protein